MGRHKKIRPKNPVGRQTVWSKERQDAICALIAGGNYVEVAAHAVGISARTYRRWMELGKAGREPYSGFASAVKNAEAGNEAEIISVVKAVAIGRMVTLRDRDGKAVLDHNGLPIQIQEDPQWQAGMRLLESRSPARWMRTEKRLNEEKAKNAPFSMTLVPMDRPEAELSLLRPVEPVKVAAASNGNGNGHKPMEEDEDD